MDRSDKSNKLVVAAIVLQVAFAANIFLDWLGVEVTLLCPVLTFLIARCTPSEGLTGRLVKPTPEEIRQAFVDRFDFDTLAPVCKDRASDFDLSVFEKQLQREINSVVS